MDLEILNKNAERQVNYEFMEDQVVWTEVSEIITWIIPLLGLTKLFKGSASVSLNSVPPGSCPICKSAKPVYLSKVNPCGHLFCYTCIMEYLEESRNCPVCNAIITSDAKPRIFAEIEE